MSHHSFNIIRPLPTSNSDNTWAFRHVHRKWKLNFTKKYSFVGGENDLPHDNVSC